MARLSRALVLPVILAGCAHRAPAPVAVAPPIVAPPPSVAVAMPAGASPNMQIPAALPDGSYPTPSLGLSPKAAMWHLRVALNVAALACRGPAGDEIAARYNALIVGRKGDFAGAQAAAFQEVRSSGAKDPQDAWDDAMTRLYNYYALAPARDGFCAAADRVLTTLPAVAADGLAAYAPMGLADLDRPFIDFFRAYDAWRYQRQPVASIATVAPVTVGIAPQAAASPAIPATATTKVPVLTVDPAVFR
ncbi:MAG: hypothetical protein ACTHJR_07505 [Sphingomonas sp.]|uniref:hypothetical protein n=1 Tax=Sphingomonas sp. TaxID=28214 RepID=UPI003F80CD37